MPAKKTVRIGLWDIPEHFKIPRFPQPLYANSGGRLLAFCNIASNGSSTAENTLVKHFYPHLQVDELDDGAKRILSQKIITEISDLYVTFCNDVHSSIESPTREVIQRGISDVFKHFIPVQLQNPLTQPNSAEISLIEVAASLIPQESAITVDEVQAIHKQLNEIGNLADSSELSPAFRAVLREIVKLGNDAISHYNCRGAKGLKDAFASMLGESMIFFKGHSQEVQDSKTSEVWDKVTNLLWLLDVVVGRVLQYKALGVELCALIGWNSNIPEQ